MVASSDCQDSSDTPFTRYNRLNNRLNVCIHDTTCCPTDCSTGCMNSTCLIHATQHSTVHISHMVVKPVEQPVNGILDSVKCRMRVNITVTGRSCCSLCVIDLSLFIARGSCSSAAVNGCMLLAITCMTRSVCGCCVCRHDYS